MTCVKKTSANCFSLLVPSSGKHKHAHTTGHVDEDGRNHTSISSVAEASNQILIMNEIMEHNDDNSEERDTCNVCDDHEVDEQHDDEHEEDGHEDHDSGRGGTADDLDHMVDRISINSSITGGDCCCTCTSSYPRPRSKRLQGNHRLNHPHDQMTTDNSLTPTPSAGISSNSRRRDHHHNHPDVGEDNESMDQSFPY